MNVLLNDVRWQSLLKHNISQWPIQRVRKPSAAKLKNSYCNTLGHRCVADNTQICLEHKVIKAHFADGRYAVPSQE
jgi:hypothetical protein